MRIFLCVFNKGLFYFFSFALITRSSNKFSSFILRFIILIITSICTTNVNYKESFFSFSLSIILFFINHFLFLLFPSSLLHRSSLTKPTVLILLRLPSLVHIKETVSMLFYFRSFCSFVRSFISFVAVSSFTR